MTNIMKNKSSLCLVIFIGLLFFSCRPSVSESSQHLSTLFKSWDTFTYSVLPEIAKQKEKGIDIFNRDAFLAILQNNEESLNIDYARKFLIVEFISSGERVVTQKHLIDLSKKSHNCYSFFKDIKGNWELYNVADIDKQAALYIMDLPYKTKNKFWASGVNDVLLLSLFNKSDIKLKPIESLSRADFEKLTSYLR
jgi:hypothetical protein